MRFQRTAALLGAAMITALPALASASPDAYLGVSLQSLEGGLAEALGMEENSGVLVGQVMDESPAAAAGIESGDIIVAVGDAAVGTPSTLRREIRQHKAGEEVAVAVMRDGKRQNVNVKLGEAPEGGMSRRFREVQELRLGGDRGYLGVMTQPLSGGLGEYFGAKDGGALVSEVVEDSPAAKLGLKAGDVIVSIDGTSITNPEELRQVVRDFEEETEIEVAWLRDKKERKGKTTVEIRESPLGRHFGFRGPDRFFEEWGGDPDEVRRHVVKVFGDRESMQDTLEQLRGELEELRKEVEELKKVD